MKVLLKKSTEDMNWGGDDYDVITLNPISKALTACYLPQWSPSPLKAMLLRRLGTMKQMYLSLKVECADDIVIYISFCLVHINHLQRCLDSSFCLVGIQASGTPDTVTFTPGNDGLSL